MMDVCQDEKQAFYLVVVMLLVGACTVCILEQLKT